MSRHITSITREVFAKVVQENVQLRGERDELASRVGCLTSDVSSLVRTVNDLSKVCALREQEVAALRGILVQRYCENDEAVESLLQECLRENRDLEVFTRSRIVSVQSIHKKAQDLREGIDELRAAALSSFHAIQSDLARAFESATSVCNAVFAKYHSRIQTLSGAVHEMADNIPDEVSVPDDETPPEIRPKEKTRLWVLEQHIHFLQHDRTTLVHRLKAVSRYFDDWLGDGVVQATVAECALDTLVRGTGSEDAWPDTASEERWPLRLPQQPSLSECGDGNITIHSITANQHVFKSGPARVWQTLLGVGHWRRVFIVLRERRLEVSFAPDRPPDEVILLSEELVVEHAPRPGAPHAMALRFDGARQAKRVLLSFEGARILDSWLVHIRGEIARKLHSFSFHGTFVAERVPDLSRLCIVERPSGSQVSVSSPGTSR